MDIGGYFGFDIEERNKLPYEGLYFNSASSALVFFLTEAKAKIIYMPEYICPSLRKNIEKLSIEIREYPVNNQLYPQLDLSVYTEKGSYALIVNYFGIRDDLIQLYEERKESILFDMAQSFFYPLPDGYSGFYSPRKFLGLTDGGILSTPLDLQMPSIINRSKASDKIRHLIKRLDGETESGLKDYRIAEEVISNEGVQRISHFSEKILKSTDLQMIKNKRIRNFKILHRALHKINLLNISLDNCKSPLVYPLKLQPDESKVLRNYLISQKIFTATYWKEFLEGDNPDAKKLSHSIVALPVDQRWGETEMNHIINIIRHFQA